ncbi:hypothetical protein CHUAL_004378 [Chamberlinius hualienensis]
MAGVAPVDPSNLDSSQIQYFKNFLMSYNQLSDQCFQDCVHDFTIRDIHDKEDRCAKNCLEKYIKMNNRITQRFQEHQMLQNEAAVANAQKTGVLS